MELESMKIQWAALDEKVTELLKLNQMAMQAASLKKADTALNRLSRGVIVELIVNLMGALLLVPFIGNHLTQYLYLAPALLLFVALMLLIAFGAHQLIVLRNLNFDGPVVQLQHTLAVLRVRRIRITKWTFWIAPLLWVPLLIVALKGVLGIDVYTTLSTEWLIANMIFGVLFLFTMILVSNRYADRLQRMPALQRLMDDIAGRDLNAATAFLNDVIRFEKES